MSDNDLSDVELDHVETVYELCVDISQALGFLAYQEQKREMLEDNIGSLEQQLESLQKAAARRWRVCKVVIGEFCQRVN